MKLLLTPILLLSVGLLIFGSCKKGEEDPFFSLRSRTARVEGAWVIKELESRLTVKSIHGGDRIDDLSINETNVVSERGPVGEALYYEGKAKSRSMFFSKDGDWERIIEYEFVSNDTTLGVGGFKTIKITQNVVRLRKSGTWYFLGKGGDYKDKERLAASVMEYSRDDRIITTNEVRNANNQVVSTNTTETGGLETETYADGEKIETWTLIMLRNKSMKMERTIQSSGYTGSTPQTLEFESSGTERMELKQ